MHVFSSQATPEAVLPLYRADPEAGTLLVPPAARREPESPGASPSRASATLIGLFCSWTGQECLCESGGADGHVGAALHTRTSSLPCSWDMMEK